MSRERGPPITNASTGRTSSKPRLDPNKLVAESSDADREPIARTRFAEDQQMRAERRLAFSERIEELGVVAVEGRGGVQAVVDVLRGGRAGQQQAPGENRGAEHPVDTSRDESPRRHSGAGMRPVGGSRGRRRRGAPIARSVRAGHGVAGM